MTNLISGQSLERTVRIHGIEWPVIVTITAEDITFRIKGTQRSVTTGWVQVIGATHTPNNVPCFLHGKPYEFLKHFAAKQAAKAVAKATEENQ